MPRPLHSSIRKRGSSQQMMIRGAWSRLHKWGGFSSCHKASLKKQLGGKSLTCSCHQKVIPAAATKRKVMPSQKQLWQRCWMESPGRRLDLSGGCFHNNTCGGPGVSTADSKEWDVLQHGNWHGFTPSWVSQCWRLIHTRLGEEMLSEALLLPLVRPKDHLSPWTLVGFHCLGWWGIQILWGSSAFLVSALDRSSYSTMSWLKA